MCELRRLRGYCPSGALEDKSLRLRNTGKLDQNDVSLLRHRLRDGCWHKQESYRLNKALYLMRL